MTNEQSKTISFEKGYAQLVDEAMRPNPQPRPNPTVLPLVKISFATSVFQPRTKGGNIADSAGHVAVLASPERRKRKEAYLEVLDLKEIIQSTANWPHFEQHYSVPLEGEKKGKKFYTSWIEKYNDLRRIAAHKNDLRTYSEDDLQFIAWLASEIAAKLEPGDGGN